MDTAYHRITISQSSVLYKNGGHRPPAGIYLGFISKNRVSQEDIATLNRILCVAMSDKARAEAAKAAEEERRRQEILAQREKEYRERRRLEEEAAARDRGARLLAGGQGGRADDHDPPRLGEDL